MTEPRLSLTPADDRSLRYVETLLEANGLPAVDVYTTPGQFHIGAAADGPVGIGGLECYGSDGLLRSVVVEEPARGRGFGTALCDALEATATAEGVSTLYLLTESAVEFFANRGYEVVDRGVVPDPIRTTSQFTDLCPASATCMWKAL